MFRDFLLGFVRIHILHHACEDEIYGVGIMDELNHHGYELGAGTLYPILHKMEREKHLVSEERVVNGKVRKYYKATPAGRKTLADAKKMLGELVDEVMAD